ncbi:phosphoribosylamine--glycine ligase [Desulfobacterota bacterium M19]
MKILVIGSGGREHALVWKLKQSPKVTEIFCAPGNAGIADMAQCLDIGAGEMEKLAEFALTNGVNLTFVGPEEPLTLGIVDYFESRGLRAFGPTKAAAVLEGSKVFMKDLLAKYNIPSGFYQAFTRRDEAAAFIREKGAPIVVKADGLAAGKGVIVADNVDEALAAVDLMLADQAFGKAGKRVIVEEFLAGEEASFLAFTDGRTILPLPSAQDHKAVFDGDKGPNTGGMGAYSPAPVLTRELERQVMDEIMYPTVRAMAAEGRPYKGILYAGLMIKDGRARVLEFNCRFGDPETQPLLMRLKTDLVDLMEGVVDNNLADVHLKIDPRPAVCVVMASDGYPGSYEKGRVITGLDQDFGDDLMVFHAGTSLRAGGEVVTSGGRVLGITARAADLRAAVDAAYEAVKKISWPGCFYRSDIGRKALNRLTGKHPVQVGIVLGSASDLPVFKGCTALLREMGIVYEVIVASAHRSPERAADYAGEAKNRGMRVLIAGAGMAAHLAGVLAAHTILPVIGVPVASSSLQGFDSLLSTVQMPPGVPVATMAVGSAGARNAAILAAQMMALSDDAMAGKLVDFKRRMAEDVVKASAGLED